MAIQKKSTSRAAASRSGSKAKGGSSRSSAKKKPFRRELAGAICIFLALCVLVSYTAETAPVVAWLRNLLCGLFGYGYYLMAAALAAAGWFLIRHHGRPVVLRTVFLLLIPVLLSGFLHVIFGNSNYPWEGVLTALYRDGLALQGGGALAGFFAYAIIAAMGKVLCGILLFVALLVSVFIGLRIDVEQIVEWLKNREKLEYEPEPEKPRPEKAQPAVRSRQTVIDIPLDGEERRKSPEKKNSFFRHKDKNMRTPDQVLTGTVEEPVVPADEAETEPAAELRQRKRAPMPVFDTPAPAEEVQPIKIKEEPVRVTEEDLQEMAQEISQGMEKTVPSYQYPPLSLLDRDFDDRAEASGHELRENSQRLADTLRSFGVDARPYDVVRGPAVTRYEFTLEQGVKLSRITNLADDIALALGASGVRIAPIPDKISVVGIEVPNKVVVPVYIREVLESRAFQDHKSSVAFAVGKDIGGNHVVGNIAKLPHVLIAGTTGSGKSVCTNSLIVSMLYKSSPEDVRFIMVDPKMVELAPYNGIPHLLIPVVTDPKKAASALQWAVYEMMKRYKLFSEHNVKDLEGYNRLAAKPDSGLQKLPTVVVVIDELADLMLVAAKEVEESICRVAQMGRASGMHLVIATQRPSADVITGLMKANIPSRISFAVASAMESRIILDNGGAEKLVGRGDMLYSPLGEGKPRRVQGCLITAEEIEKVVAFVKQSGETQYSDEVIAKIDEFGKEKGSKSSGGRESAAPQDNRDEGDELLPAAVEVVLETGQASVSMLQRRLKLGYSRAARIVDEMEQRGIVGPFEGSKPRALLITKEQWQQMQMGGQQEEIPLPDDSDAPPF